MSDSAIAVTEPLNQVRIDERRSSSGHRLLRLFFYFFSDCLFARLLAAVFICQAAIMWLGTALNFILQLLFIPFSFAASSNMFSFLASYSMIPGIVAFSAHYFWFVLQIGCHCFTTNVRQSASKRSGQGEGDENQQPTYRTNALLFFIDHEIGWCHVNVKQLYRLFVSLSSIGYTIYYATKDPLNCLIVPTGQVPLALMWGLHVLHLLGLAIYVVLTVCSNWNKTNEAMKPLTFRPRSHLSGILILVILILLPILYHLFAICFNVLVGLFIFILWIFLFHQTWAPPPPSTRAPTDDDEEGAEDTRDHLNNMKQLYCANLCSIFFRGPLDRYYDSRMITRLTRVFTYKVFILVLLSLMLTSLVIVFRRSSADLSSVEYAIQITLIILLVGFELLLLLPPFIARWNILRIQMNFIQHLLILIFVLLIVGVILLIKNDLINQSVMIICILPLLIYAFLLTIFYLYHSVRDSWHYLRGNRQTRLVPGLVEWIECHHTISLYVNAYYMIFLILALIGIAGLTLASSMLFYNNKDLEQNNDRQDYIPLYGNDSLRVDPLADRMEACNWRFEEFTIEDMMLFAALAYQPTEYLQEEINHFYPKEANESKTMFIDLEHSQFQSHGYGNVTFFTLITNSSIVVSIRGTKLLYEWLIDFDTWNEAFLYQVLSILFPWSKLFPEYLTARIIKHLSILERLVNKNLQQLNKQRFYLQQLVPKLKEIRRIYRDKRSFILVGHSLGGGLAKLSGAALVNETSVVVSVNGPGITYSHAKMDATKRTAMSAIHKKIFNIYHDRDVVSWSDKQEGLQQAMTCPLKYTFLQCHYMNPLMCSVISQCGNSRAFRFNRTICHV